MYLDHLKGIWNNSESEYVISKENTKFTFRQILDSKIPDLSKVRPGDCVAIVGDFSPTTTKIFLELASKKAIIMPLSEKNATEHDTFFKIGNARYVVRDSQLIDLGEINKTSNVLIEELRIQNSAGLLLFTSGTTGQPKAILHNFDLFMQKYLNMNMRNNIFISFLLFDHIGGINTLFSSLFSKSSVVIPVSRNPEHIGNLLELFRVEILPTTPTFLRMLMYFDEETHRKFSKLRVITYGTEVMDENTLNSINILLPEVEFRQTYGMSELGIFRIKSESNTSLYFKFNDERVDTRINKDNLLQINSKSRMVGYLNHPSPFYDGGWFDTQDIVEIKNGFIKVLGRNSKIVNIGGLKVNPEEIQSILMEIPGIRRSRVYGVKNPITGNHLEADVAISDGNSISEKDIKLYLSAKLERYKIPNIIRIKDVPINYRFKRL